MTFQTAITEADISPMSIVSWPVSNQNSVSGSANYGKKNAGSILTCQTREPPSLKFLLILLKRIKKLNSPT